MRVPLTDVRMLRTDRFMWFYGRPAGGADCLSTGGAMEPLRSSTDIAHLVLGVGSGAWQLASWATQPFRRLGGGILDGMVAAGRSTGVLDRGEGVRRDLERVGLRLLQVGVVRAVETMLAVLDLTEVVRAHVDLDALVAAVDVDAVVRRVDLNAAAAGLDLDALVAAVDLDAVVRRVDLDAVVDAASTWTPWCAASTWTPWCAASTWTPWWDSLTWTWRSGGSTWTLSSRGSISSESPVR